MEHAGTPAWQLGLAIGDRRSAPANPANPANPARQLNESLLIQQFFTVQLENSREAMTDNRSVLLAHSHHRQGARWRAASTVAGKCG